MNPARIEAHVRREFELEEGRFEAAVAYLLEAAAIARLVWNCEEFAADHSQTILEGLWANRPAKDVVIELGDYHDLVPGGGGRRYGDER